MRFPTEEGRKRGRSKNGGKEEGSKKRTDRRKETKFDILLIIEWRINSSLAYVYVLRPPVDAPTLGYY